MKTIQEQVSELTAEQKDSMKTIYKKYLISLLSLVVIAAIVSAGVFFYLTLKMNGAKARWETIENQIELQDKNNEMFGTMIIDMSLNDECTEAMNIYYDLSVYRWYSFMLFGILVAGGTVVLLLVIKKKYPYFSEKKYEYMKKNNMI